MNTNDSDFALAPSAEERRSILKERARVLAQEPGQARAAGEFLDLVEFRLASETYAIEHAFVREVHPLKDLAPLPATPPFVLGIVNLRGQILSVVDLRIFFGLPVSGLGDLNKIIVIRDEKMEFGILADCIIGAHSVPRAAIQRPIPTLTGIGVEYLMGITVEGLIVLDAQRILGDERIIVDQE
jgi:purine-binding chemotaxis protein CheW